MSIDPKVAQTDQPYVFTNDNPLNATDPLGLCCVILHDIAHAFDAVRHQIAKNVDSGNRKLRPPLLSGGLAPGSSAAEARSELSKIGVKVPDNYAAYPARNGKGWNFSPPDDVGTENNLIRAMDSSNNPKMYRYGDANVYDSAGNPVNARGLTPVDRADWHQSFKPFEEPGGSFEFDGE